MSSNEVPHTLAVGNGIVIWADTAKIQQFLATITPDVDAGPSNIVVNVPGTTISRYPGDPAPYTRGPHTRRVLVATKAKFQTTPGRAFTVETEIPLSDPLKYDVSQFTFVGAFVDLHAAFLADAAVDLILRSPNGSPYSISAAGP